MQAWFRRQGLPWHLALLAMLALAGCERGSRDAAFGPRGTALAPPDAVTGAVSAPPPAR